MGRENLDKVEYVTTQVTIAADTDAGCAWLEQVAGVNGPQMFVALGFKRHLRQNANA